MQDSWRSGQLDLSLLRAVEELSDQVPEATTTRATLVTQLPRRSGSTGSASGSVYEDRDGSLDILIRIEKYPSSIHTECEVPDEENGARQLFDSPWWPFQNGDEFKLGGWFIDSNTPKIKMNLYFNMGLGLGQKNKSDDVFKSDHSFQKLLNSMGNPLTEWKDGVINFKELDVDHPVVFHYHDLEPILTSFFKEPYFQNRLVFMPEKHVSPDNIRVFSEMHTGDWWWETQVCRS